MNTKGGRKDKESVWTWDDNSPQECAFRRLKNFISEAPLLSYYNPNLPVTSAADASQFGLGGHIRQEGHPVAYWTMSLDASQRNYDQIVTDYKPLLGLIREPLDSLSPRFSDYINEIRCNTAIYSR
ncbi:RNase H-like domain found in reverse transcriptase [Popillia japonica]|uniref:RNase H-like domain found in reverse transcriptase n=1 Tax=Popillia japonica TaxID=7064 RepID=A0AAW1MYF3_POPJA